jgi:hypothetical protein
VNEISWPRLSGANVIWNCLTFFFLLSPTQDWPRLHDGQITLRAVSNSVPHGPKPLLHLHSSLAGWIQEIILSFSSIYYILPTCILITFTWCPPHWHI